MGHQIIIQPDGKLAIFSSGVDAWIVMDGTPEEIADYYADRAARKARESARDTIEQVLQGRERQVYAQFALTFEQANELSLRHDGQYWSERYGRWLDEAELSAKREGR